MNSEWMNQKVFSHIQNLGLKIGRVRSPDAPFGALSHSHDPFGFWLNDGRRSRFAPERTYLEIHEK